MTLQDTIADLEARLKDAEEDKFDFSLKAVAAALLDRDKLWEAKLKHHEHQAKARDLHIERIKAKCSRIANAENRLKMRIRQLEAANILADAGMAIAEKGLIKENEVIAPYLEMKSRAEEAEDKLKATETELADMKVIAEKCLDPEYMKTLLESEIVVGTVKQLKESQRLEKETHDKLLAQVQESMLYQAGAQQSEAKCVVLSELIEMKDAALQTALGYARMMDGHHSLFIRMRLAESLGEKSIGVAKARTRVVEASKWLKRDAEEIRWKEHSDAHVALAIAEEKESRL